MNNLIEASEPSCLKGKPMGEGRWVQLETAVPPVWKGGQGAIHGHFQTGVAIIFFQERGSFMFSRTRSFTSFVVLSLFLCVIALAVPATAGTTRTVKDQLGRDVVLPENVERVVCLEHHALDIILELQAGDSLVGVLQKWNKRLAGVDRIYPRLEELPMPGDLKSVNMEELLKLDPDVVIVTHYAPREMWEPIEKAGVPVVLLSFYVADLEEASKLNPELKDPDKAYTEGMKQAVRILGDVLGKQDKAESLVSFIEEKRALVSRYLTDVPEGSRVRCYMANPELHTYGTGKYTGVIMSRAGGRNVAGEIKGYQQVNMEQVLLWDPEVVFVQARYENLIDEITGSSSWQKTSAVRNGQVYLSPEYVKPWGHPCPESFALGELWMAKKLYPEQFKDVDMATVVNEFYERFYGVPYKGSH